MWNFGFYLFVPSNRWSLRIIENQYMIINHDEQNSRKLFRMKNSNDNSKMFRTSKRDESLRISAGNQNMQDEQHFKYWGRISIHNRYCTCKIRLRIAWAKVVITKNATDDQSESHFAKKHQKKQHFKLLFDIKQKVMLDWYLCDLRKM